MSEDPIKVAVLAAAEAAGFVLGPQSEVAVVANARLLATRYAEFADIPLTDDLEPAALLNL